MTARYVSLLLVLLPSLASAQSLEPRLYLPLPTGLNVVVASYTHTTGDIVVDGSLPITDLRATANAVTPAYVRTFGLLGRSAQVQAVIPIVSSTARAQILGQDTSRSMNGLADPTLRLAVNLKGGPARSRAQLAGVRFGTIVGASLSVMPPLGQYDPDRYLNLGANRWSFKPELGIVQPLSRKWALEGYLGLWLFGKNTEFPGPATLTQDPVLTLQGHLIHIFNRRGYLALDGTVVRGGTSEVDGVELNNFQENARFGATTAWSVGRGHTIKAVFSTGVLTRAGGDFDLFSVGYQYSWGR
jgi:hypothetical protein